MPIQKTPVQFFFGATDQDTSKKGVRSGDLVTATNVQQLHPGEMIKRGGFTQSSQTFDSPSTVEADSLTSPDGVQVLIRDSITDTAFARAGSSTTNVSRGASQRVLCTPNIRFPSLESGIQEAPMAKQSGDYFVWLHDETHFVIAHRSSDDGSIIEQTDPIAVNGGFGDTPSTHVKSFAIIDAATFDADALWIFWVDWTSGVTYRDSIWAYRVPHATLDTPTAFRVAAGTDAEKCATSISVAVVPSGRLTVAVCGVTGAGGTPPIAFREDATAGPLKSYVDFWQYTYATGSLTTIGSGSAEQTTTNRNWVGSGICILSAKDVTEEHEDGFYVSFWGASATADSADLLVYHATESTGVMSGYVVATVNATGYASSGSTQINFLGSTTGYETATGATVIAQFRVYYENSGFVDPDDCYYPDRLYTACYAYAAAAGGSSSTIWTARGSWLAHGWFERSDSVKYVITGWEDADAIQLPYHLRRVDTGAIVAQFGYGIGAHAAGTATKDAQIDGHLSDLNQPAIQASPVVVAIDNMVLLQVQSANVNGSLDIASVALSKPTYQSPSTIRKLEIAPGPIPTIVSGWQPLREAGPLVSPPTFGAYWGQGSS